ncbi:hypothetical protein [Streptosporangium carneum]|uniref:XRE family transcriptional regulator n=1 Tax=Streptosporangium carneum TaxID=47481 RepID=A0A9W6HXC5_9ACTN|nr:hypothetical protein [Streptosporangium carneum]GLK07822.1 hypothetical protein GCM10017600_12270 [Streptosporangium carneum]
MARALTEAADERTRDRLPARQSITRMIKDWEAGRHKPKDPYRLLYCRVLGVSEDELFDEGAGPSAGREEDDVLRREFLSASVAAIGITAVPMPLGDLSRGRRVNDELVVSLRRRFARLRRIDDYLGGAETYPLYAAELERTSVLVNEASYTEATGRALLGVISEQAQQAGWAAFDAGWQNKARQLFKRSLSAAVDAGDTALLANSLAFLAYQKVSAGSPGTQEADASCRIAESGTPPTVRALLLERAAWAYASEGQHYQAEVERSLEQAGEALEEGRSEPGPDWAIWVDRLELQIMTGRCWVALGRPKNAIPVLERALAGYDDTHARDKSLYMTWLAEAYLGVGEVEQASAVLSRSLDLSIDVASVRPRQRVESVLGRLGKRRSLPCVTELFDRTATLSSSSAIPDMEPTHRQLS